MSDLLPANVTLLQPGSKWFMLQQALQALDIATQVTSALAALQTQVNNQQSEIVALQGQVSTLQGQVTTLQNQQQVMTAFMAAFNYNQIEVSTGMIFLDQRNIYRRSFVINGALNTAINVFTYPHGIPALSYIVNIQAMAGAATALQYPITFLNMATAPTLSTGLSCWADATNIYISVGTTVFSGIQVLATMWYTATNR